MAAILVLGATGMTGQPLVEQLLANNHNVRVIVRSTNKLASDVINNPNTTIVERAVLDLSEVELAEQLKGCDAVVSCLGHVLSFKGMFGEPKKLCTQAARRSCEAILKNNQPAPAPVKFILMNTVGVKNPECDAPRAWYERALIKLLSLTIPPQRDNETAAQYLQQTIANNSPNIEWCTVRPDSLINGDCSPYEIQPSPTTGIFSGRPTTRANVASFMVALIEDPELWDSWKFKTPVIMNA